MLTMLKIIKFSFKKLLCLAFRAFFSCCFYIIFKTSKSWCSCEADPARYGWGLWLYAIKFKQITN